MIVFPVCQLQEASHRTTLCQRLNSHYLIFIMSTIPPTLPFVETTMYICNHMNSSIMVLPMQVSVTAWRNWYLHNWKLLSQITDNENNSHEHKMNYAQSSSSATSVLLKLFFHDPILRSTWNPQPKLTMQHCNFRQGLCGPYLAHDPQFKKHLTTPSNNLIKHCWHICNKRSHYNLAVLSLLQRSVHHMKQTTQLIH